MAQHSVIKVGIVFLFHQMVALLQLAPLCIMVIMVLFQDMYEYMRIFPEFGHKSGMVSMEKLLMIGVAIVFRCLQTVALLQLVLPIMTEQEIMRGMYECIRMFPEFGHRSEMT